jgi:YD repeat-containing protein
VSDYFPDNNCNENSSQFLSGKYWAFSSPTVTFGQVTSQYLYYGKVTERNSNNGSIESYYNVDDLNEETTDFNNSYYPAFSTYPLLNAGKLIKEIYKDNDGNAIKENDFTYEKNEKLVECGNPYIIFQPFCIQRTLSLSESTGYSYLTQKNEITFGKTYPINPDDYLIKTTKYDYANAFGSDYPDHHFVEKQTVTESNGSSSIENMRYPLDYPISGSVTNSVAQGIQNLQNNHIIAPLVEKYTQKLNGSTLTTTEALFYTYKPTLSLPDVVYKLQSSSPLSSFLPTTISNTSVTMNSNYKPEIQFDSYDSYNNLLQQHKFNDNNKAYLWDYDYKYPVAIVENAIQSDIAYSSFEADDKGNWSFSGTSQPVADAPTGKYVMQLSGSNSISKSGLVSGTTYIVTYWAKGGSAYANGAAGEALVTKGDWTLYKNTLTGISSVVISGNSIIDELRLYPATAQMTTYTYEPLVGMTSQCDANNRITYYEYDSFGRLILIKDQDGNILKKFCYNYAGQVGQCSVYLSDAINADYYSQNCSSGQSPVAYHVSVPQGMFTSSVDQPTANQQAQQYAQNQANQYGTCEIANITLYGDDEVGSDFSITLHNTSTGQDYSFNLYAHNESTLDDVPPGDYDISLTPLSSTGYYSYSVGCGYYDEGPGGSTITFYAVPLSSGCNVITIN